ncbi:MAG TPA: hypothetical protein VFA67_08465 [Candidatus Sulfotelmatobacter sp.]|nr:hypothetical protein [Candidatus Sulfotelmatobacter sp.]
MHSLGPDHTTRDGWRAAVQYWEPCRAWYNAVLFAVVMLWLVLTWPHFRPALNWMDLGRMAVLGLLANLCYCAAYVAEFFLQGGLPARYWRPVRFGIWVLGLLLALVFTNYWIADEIYPDFTPATSIVNADINAPGAGSNMNFPAPVAVVGFLAACGGAFIALAATVIFWFARKPQFSRVAAIALGAGALLYIGLLVGFSVASHDTALGLGQEKYFCEIDCHLAYSVVNVSSKLNGDSKDYVVTLRTRFDEKTISPQRVKGASLTPSPREARVIDRAGHAYEPVSTAGNSLMSPLRPGNSYTTELEFRVPRDASGLRLLIRTTPGWPDRILIGDENSWLHKKTYFAL